MAISKRSIDQLACGLALAFTWVLGAGLGITRKMHLQLEL